MRYKPNESANTFALLASRADWISKPPGVKMMAKEIQKPPKEESAVAPNVFPTAISLRRVSRWCSAGCTRTASERDPPHAGQELDEPSVSERDRHHDVGIATQAERVHVDQAQQKGGEGEGAESQGSRVGEFAALDRLERPGLEFAAERGVTAAAATDVGQRAVPEPRCLLCHLVLLWRHVRGVGVAGALVMGGSAVAEFLVSRSVGAVGSGCGSHVD